MDSYTRVKTNGTFVDVMRRVQCCECGKMLRHGDAWVGDRPYAFYHERCLSYVVKSWPLEVQIIALDILRRRFGVNADPMNFPKTWFNICADVEAQLQLDRNSNEQEG